MIKCGSIEGASKSIKSFLNSSDVLKNVSMGERFVFGDVEKTDKHFFSVI